MTTFKPQATAPLTSVRATGMDRRAFITTTAAGLGAVALGAPTRARAQGRKEISFASASFFGSETFGDLVKTFNESQDRITVKYLELPPPSSSTEVYQRLVQLLARRNGTPDVFSQDAIWIAGFAAAGWALPLDEFLDADARSQYFTGTLNACTWDNKVTALPWFMDTGMMYYRKDLVEKHNAKVPEQWADMVALGQAAVKAGDCEFGYIWQGKQAEVLVCNAVELIASNNGAILADDGRSSRIGEPEAIAAIKFLYDSMNSYGISPKDVLSWDEEPSRQPFTAGKSIFTRNWSYVWPIAQDPAASIIVGKVGASPLPHFPGGKSASCLGGYQLGLNANTKERDASWEFMSWLSAPEQQRRIALNFGLGPSRPALFDDAELNQKQPFMATLRPVFTNATPRPVTPEYAKVTLALQSGISKALVSGEVEKEMLALATQLNALVR
ncbi:MAG TPA: ABC transporter substrate-binding protein [Paenirhodobacter sp.]